MAIVVEPRKFHIGDVITLTLILADSLSGLSTNDLAFYLTRPDGGVVTMGGSKAIVSSDTGQVTIATQSTDFDEAGTYLIQVKDTSNGRYFPHATLRVSGVTTP